MPFPERIKLLAKVKAAFRCCVCHKPFVDVHHLIPEAKGGPSTIANAAPLCASCHDLYGGNPDKRKALSQMRDNWWLLIEERNKRLADISESRPPYEITEKPHFTGGLRRSRMMLYHRVFPTERFEKSAKILLELVCNTQKHAPNQKRILWLDIDGHRRKDGWFDSDMAELQLSFLGKFLIQFVTEVHAPLLRLRNKRQQSNDVPTEIRFFKNDAHVMQKAVKENIDKLWIADQGIMVGIHKNSIAKTESLCTFQSIRQPI